MLIVKEPLLSVLQAALYVVKWEGEDDDSSRVAELAGSPYFAELHHRVVDELISLEADKPPLVQKWNRWRAIEERPEHLERTKKRIRETTLWKTWSMEEKREWVEILLSPFWATAPTLDDLLSM